MHDQYCKDAREIMPRCMIAAWRAEIDSLLGACVPLDLDFTCETKLLVQDEITIGGQAARPIAIA